jgi:hypothetical protein
LAFIRDSLLLYVEGQKEAVSLGNTGISKSSPTIETQKQTSKPSTNKPHVSPVMIGPLSKLVFILPSFVMQNSTLIG